MSDLIRVMTAGQVDDGKSTLLGRLVYDSGNIYQDQLQALSKSEDSKIDYSQIFDSLENERQNKITIDVAYRYFYHKQNKIILADCPGHVEYMKNLATAALNSDFAIVLIDASRGIHEQTRRHLYGLQLFGVTRVIFAINKMDLVNYSEKNYQKIKQDILNIVKGLKNISPVFIPTSGYRGDNVVHKSNNMSFYQGPTLLEIIVDYKKEDVKAGIETDIKKDIKTIQPIAVQYVKEESDTRYIFGNYLCASITSISLQTASNLEIQRGDLFFEHPTKQKKISTIQFELLSLSPLDFSSLSSKHNSKLIFKMLYFESEVSSLNFTNQIDLSSYQQTANSNNYQNHSFYQGNLSLVRDINLDEYIKAKQNKFILFDSESYDIVAVGRALLL